MPADRTELDLIDRARRGEREAMEGLVVLHQDRLFAVLRRCVPADEVDDLAQEVFLRVFRRLDRFRGEARFGTWLFQIMRNLLIDRHRGRRRAPARVGLREETGDPDDAHVVDPGPTPEEVRSRRALEARLASALDRLAERDRLAILLHDQEGMTAAEVAAIVGGSAGAVRIRLMRARARLRVWLREREG